MRRAIRARGDVPNGFKAAEWDGKTPLKHAQTGAIAGYFSAMLQKFSFEWRRLSP
jgi:hypothetical protein